MELSLAMQVLRPGENVSPDLSSYAAMVANWRGSGTPPTEAECLAAWQTADAAAYEGKRRIEYTKQGVTIDAMIVALWEKIVENKPQAMNDLQTKRLRVKSDIPKPS